MTRLRTTFGHVRAAWTLHEGSTADDLKRLARAAFDRLQPDLRLFCILDWIERGGLYRSVAALNPPLDERTLLAELLPADDAVQRLRAVRWFFITLERELREALGRSGTRTTRELTTDAHRASARDERERVLGDRTLQYIAFQGESIPTSAAMRAARVMEDHVGLAREYYRAGFVPEAFRAIRTADFIRRSLPESVTLTSRVDLVTTELLAVYADIQMQRGVQGDSAHSRGALSLAQQVLRRLHGNSRARRQRARALQIKALCHRQRDELVAAAASYNLALDALDTTRWTRERMNLLHDLAVSLFLHGCRERVESAVSMAADMLSTSNTWFDDHDPVFAQIGAIRHAELLVKRGEAVRAANVLDAYADEEALDQLSRPFRVIYYASTPSGFLCRTKMKRVSKRSCER